MSRPILVVCLFLVLPLFVGCGGGEDAKPTPRAPVVQAPQAAAPVVVGGEQPAPAAARPAGGGNPAARPRPKATPLPKGASAGDVFVVVEDGDQFVVSDTPATTNENDEFLVTPKVEGTSSSTFEVVGSRRAAEGTMRPGFALPPNFRVLAQYGFNDQGYPKRILCTTDNSQMALVSPGNFVQGTDDGPENAAPAHSVYLDEYYIDVAEVTLAQYTAFRRTLGDTEKRTARISLNAEGEPFDPVHGVRYSDAVAYAKWCGKELPTEAEWEKAARGTKGEFPWGNGRTFFSRHREQTDVDRIMSFPQDVSPYGVWDMAGNVREWCADWYADDAYQKAFDGGETFSNWIGPRNPGPDYLRVVKGNGPNWAAWHREGLDGAKQVPGVGFRCVLRKPPASRTANR